MSGSHDEERAAGTDDPALQSSSNGEVDLLLDTTANTAAAAEATDAVKNDLQDTVDTSLSTAQHDNVSSNNTDYSVEAVTKIVNEVRGLEGNESPLLLPQNNVEAMEQGSRHYRDDPNQSDDDYSFSPSGVWNSSKLPQPKRYNFIGSIIRSQFSMYFVIVAALVGIGVGISAAITKGIERTQHRNGLLHPKWENDGVAQTEQNVDTGIADSSTTTTLENNSEGSIMQPDISSSAAAAEVYTDAQESLAYQIANSYIPIWFDRESGWNGSTHAEAVDFCKSRSDSSSLQFVPCPYDVYCPGDGTKILFDEEVGEADSWAPTFETNVWVQVGSGGRVCESVKMDDLGEQLTKHVMCCLEEPMDLEAFEGSESGIQTPTDVTVGEEDSSTEDNFMNSPFTPPSAPTASSEATIYTTEEQSLANLISITYIPIWYDRDSGWNGSTYAEAVEFCKSSGDTSSLAFVPCPYEIYCPFEEKKLLFDEKVSEADSWAPVLEENMWVQVGNGGNTCDSVQMDDLDEQFTRYIMCCVEEPLNLGGIEAGDIEGQVISDAVEDTQDSSNAENTVEVTMEDIVEDSTTSSSPETTTIYTAEEQSLANQIANTYIPIWFNRESGWNGITHTEAVEFCKSNGTPSLVFVPCPYDVYCPFGGNKLLFEENFDQADSWAPVSENNKWVQVGYGGRTCDIATMDHLGEQLTRNIMCCLEHPLELGQNDEASDKGVQAPPNVLEEGGDSNVDDPIPPPPMNIVQDESTEPSIEQSVFDKFRPAWFSDEEGWSGTTYGEARQFCESVDGDRMHLCPLEIYCPNGQNGNKPLHFHIDSYDGEQWAPVSDNVDQWVMLRNDGYETCVVNPPQVSVDTLASEVKKYLLCCHEPLEFVNDDNDVLNGADTLSSESTDISIENMNQIENLLFEKYQPTWFNDKSGWWGSTYEDAKRFCGSVQNEMSLCPSEVYCPDNAMDNKPLYYEMDAYEGEQWAPVSDNNEQWVMLGKNGYETCSLNPPQMSIDALSPSMKKFILCCKGPHESSTDVVGQSDGGDGNLEAPEIDLEHFDFQDSVLEDLNPVWYGSDEWIAGSHDDASHFCTFKGKHLCPYAAYCPYGPGNAVVDGWVSSMEFEEQWAPTIKSNQWVQIGAVHNNPRSQCDVIDSPSFGFDMSQPEVKLHIMCCDKASEPEVVTSTIDSYGPPKEPVWYGSNDGWDGGGHEDAMLYCIGKKKTLCPVESYCPDGPKKPPIYSFGGSSVIEQWAPASDEENYWIMIGVFDDDFTTQCQDQYDLIGGYPSWGLDGSYSEHKQHILCCASS